MPMTITHLVAHDDSCLLLGPVKVVHGLRGLVYVRDEDAVPLLLQISDTLGCIGLQVRGGEGWMGKRVRDRMRVSVMKRREWG